MKLRTTNQPVSWLQVLFLLVVIVYCSCKKTDTGITDRQQLSGDEFFKKPVNSTAELNAVIELLKKEALTLRVLGVYRGGLTYE